MKAVACTLVTMFMLAGCRAGSMTEARRQQQLESFDYIWQTVKDKHYDPKLNGVDWDAVRAELRPKVQKAKNDDEARDAMLDMLSRLKLSHYAIYAGGKTSGRHGGTPFVPPLAKDAPAEKVQFASLPEVEQRYVYKRLPDNVGYFYLSIFLDVGKVMPAFRKGIDDARTADGFILDLRHNPGGIGGMAMGLGNAFVTEKNQKLGEMIQRDTTLSFVLNPQANPYSKPLAILVDGGSASTSEILAGGLKDLKRARIFGTRSIGMALPSVIEPLPNGDTFQYAVANYISTGGQTLEGHGVEPDEVVKYDPPYNEPDPVVAAAVKWIKSQSEKKP